MFDLLLPVHCDVAAAGAVEDQSPELDEELAVPRIASVDLHVDVLAVGGACPCRGGAVADRHGRRRGVDADRTQRRGEVVERRGRIGRTEHEVHQRASSPADRQRAETLAGWRPRRAPAPTATRRPMSQRPNFLSGATKYGLATVIAAAPAANASDGNGWRRRHARSRQDVGGGVLDDPPDERHCGHGEHHARRPVAQQRPRVCGPGDHRDDDDPDLYEVERCRPDEIEQCGERRHPVGRMPTRSSPGSPTRSAVTAMMTSDSVSSTTSVGRRKRSDVDGTAKSRALIRRDLRSDMWTRW